MALSCLALGIAMHVGGFPTPAQLQTPAGVGNVADQGFDLAWLDNDQDPTGTFTFYFQPTNVRPDAVVGDLGGEPVLPDGGTVAIADPLNRLTWSTATVPAGSYAVYAVTHDAPLPEVFAVSRGVVTVRHDGDPLFPAVVVTDPGSLAPEAADGYAIRWQASGDGPLLATIEGRPRGSTGAFQVIAADVPMADLVGGQAAGCAVWDMRDLPQGHYEVRVEVRDPAGLTHAGYAVSHITIYRDPHDVDAGPPPSCAGGAAIDAGAGEVEPSDAPGCGCRAGGRGRPGVGAALAMLVALGLRRRRR